MLTYAVPVNLAAALVLRNVKRFPTVAEADRDVVGQHLLVFEGNDFVLVFPINNLWDHFAARLRYAGKFLTVNSTIPMWGRRVELYVRLRLKLRARYSRLRHKQHHHSTPTDQRTSEACPAA